MYRNQCVNILCMRTHPRFTRGNRTVAVPVQLAAALGLDGRPLAPDHARFYREVVVPSRFMEMPMDTAPEWTCACRLGVQDGRVVITELRIFPTETWKGREKGTWSGEWSPTAAVPRGGIRSRMLRLRLGQVEAETRAFLTWAAKQPGGSTVFEVQRWLGEPLRHRGDDRPPRQRRERRPPPDDLYLATIAAQYEVFCLTDPRQPVQALAKKLDRDRREVTQLVYLARQRKILPKSSKGKSGGRLTAYGRRLLAARSSPPTAPRTRRRRP